MLGSVTTGFVYDGPTVVQELLGMHNTDPVKAHLLTGGVDALFLRIEGNDGSRRNSVLGDANRNVVMLLDGAQQPVVNYTYEPYGATTADVVTPNTQQYTSRENDAIGNSQGLYYYRARYYVAGIGRFVSEDPIGWTSGQANNYAYVGGDPIDFRDPFGLEAGGRLESLSGGIGDYLIGGLGPWLRKKLGVSGVDTCSGWYTGGRLLSSVGLSVATGLAEGGGSEGAGADGSEFAPNAVDQTRAKLDHIFLNAEHNLGPLLADFGGSETAAFQAISSAADAAVSAGGLTGVYEVVVQVGARFVTVRGKVVDGITRIGSAWIP